MRETILIVDDDEMNLRMAEFILRQEDFDVHTVKSGMECLLYLRDHKVDLVLLDLEMPVMSGLKTLEIMRENKDMADVKVIFLTAFAEKENVIEASKLGIVDYVSKPFHPLELLRRVGNAF